VSASPVAGVDGLEILDSRGRPTVEATVRLRSGAVGTASVPSGASTGAAEAVELRDGDSWRHAGMGCRKAVANVRGELATAVRGRVFASQAELDRALIEADGSANKSRLGANAILAVSLAYARAAAAERGAPLYEHLQPLAGDGPALPRPMVNLFSGGAHAGGQVAVQDVQVIPLRTGTIDDALALVTDVYRSAAALAERDYGMRLLTADEGGLAPAFASSDAMLDAAVEAIRRCGLEPGEDVGLAVDVAASQLLRDGAYRVDGTALDSDAMIDRVTGWVDRLPIVSVEDGLAEDDWEHWPPLAARLRGRAIVLGDDLMCTNPARIARAVDLGAADALLLKVNQVGTLSEAAEAFTAARAAAWRVVASARSGETEDSWLADLAVAWGADFVKIGSVTQSERLAKYNRLLAIECETGHQTTPSWRSFATRSESRPRRSA
jgi:enolase